MTDQQQEWQPIRPFGIDSGELDNLSRQECFVLGYELAVIDQKLQEPGGFSTIAHAENMNRIEHQCKVKNRNFKWVWPHNDVSEMWIELFVEDQP